MEQIVSTNPECTFTVYRNMTLTAVFEQIPIYTITATIDPSGSGTVEGAGTYEEGSTVTIKAIPADGYKFTGWQENGQTVSTDNEYTFTATEDRVLVAGFDVKVARLPAGYEEVQYVDFDGNTRIAYAPTLGNFSYYGYEITMELLPESVSGTIAGKYGLYRYQQLSSYYYQYAYYAVTYRKEESKIYTHAYGYDARTTTGANGIKQTSLPIQSGKMVISWDLNSKIFSINNTTATYEPKLYTSITMGTQQIGGQGNYNFVSNTNIQRTYTALTAFRLYEFKTFSESSGNSDSTLYNHYIPCYRKSDNLVGLYDIKQNKFAYPEAGTLTAGPIV